MISTPPAAGCFCLQNFWLWFNNDRAIRLETLVNTNTDPRYQDAVAYWELPTTGENRQVLESLYAVGRFFNYSRRTLAERKKHLSNVVCLHEDNRIVYIYTTDKKLVSEIWLYLKTISAQFHFHRTTEKKSY